MLTPAVQRHASDLPLSLFHLPPTPTTSYPLLPILADELLVGDFGLAIQQQRELPFLRAGTLDYMSPEVTCSAVCTACLLQQLANFCRWRTS